MTDYKAACPMCWTFENADAEDEATAERRAVIHANKTGHRAKVVEA